MDVAVDVVKAKGVRRQATDRPQHALFRRRPAKVLHRIGVERHALSGFAKDAGSAAVMLTLLLVALTWGLILFGA